MLEASSLEKIPESTRCTRQHAGPGASSWFCSSPAIPKKEGDPPSSVQDGLSAVVVGVAAPEQELAIAGMAGIADA
eukprot:CAMPEP_0115513528 /NCGR_PEP_ID=MMETSP0271-20121206/75131_1 /TAXON_ID=71861 /ORGANISM="Scrippsiella trochoidea, Strain CCMP3099" /LENGTH=75 /DNA_ID=CAMNT_0002943839 /DNA_START=309 /DNA_END=533 /DNA_ORIENTATION=-